MPVLLLAPAAYLKYVLSLWFIGWIVLRTRSGTTKEIEILVLRHQLAVLHRQLGGQRVRFPSFDTRLRRYSG